MAKCFITGVELPLEMTHLLDIKVANRAVHALRQRLHAVEGLLKQFGTRDELEIYNPRQGKSFIRYDRRLVCEAVAQLLAEAYPEAKLFLSWPEYRERKTVVPAVSGLALEEEIK